MLEMPIQSFQGRSTCLLQHRHPRGVLSAGNICTISWIRKLESWITFKPHWRILFQICFCITEKWSVNMESDDKLDEATIITISRHLSIFNILGEWTVHTYNMFTLLVAMSRVTVSCLPHLTSWHISTDIRATSGSGGSGCDQRVTWHQTKVGAEINEGGECHPIWLFKAALGFH